MSQLPPSPASTDDLQFTTVEPAVAAGTAARQSGQVCLGCKRPIESTYFAIAGKVVCPRCAAQIQAPLAGSPLLRVGKATLLGLGAGLVGALIWFVIRRYLHAEIGLVAIVVGFMVGKAVRKGSGGRGGRGYQVLAVVLTYSCIAANYMPDVFEALVDGSRTHHSRTPHSSANSNNAPDATPTDADVSANPRPGVTASPKVGTAKAIGAMAFIVVLVFAFSLAAPFLQGAQNAIGLLIIGFALWEAWKLTARRKLPITGPYYIAQPDLVSGAPAAPASADSEVIL